MWCKVAVECHWWRPSSTISVGHSPTSPTCMCTTLKRNKLHTCQFHCEAFGYFQEYFPLINLSPGTTRQLVCKPLLVPIATWMQSRLMTHGTKHGRASTLISVITVIVESWADLSVFHLVLIYVLCLWSQMGWHRYLKKAAFVGPTFGCRASCKPNTSK